MLIYVIMMHPDTELRFINEEVGYGVVATKFIPKGTITWVQDELDQLYSPAQVQQMRPEIREMIDKFSFRNNKGKFVLCWDLSKYVNHSFNSNCMSSAYDFEIAIRDIHEGEELTDDYGYLNVTEPFRARDEGTDRTTVYPDDLLHFYREWDEKLNRGFHNFMQVEQPLIKFIPQEILLKIRKSLEQQQPLDSILNNYFQEP